MVDGLAKMFYVEPSGDEP